MVGGLLVNHGLLVATTLLVSFLPHTNMEHYTKIGLARLLRSILQLFEVQPNRKQLPPLQNHLLAVHSYGVLYKNTQVALSRFNALQRQIYLP